MKQTILSEVLRARRKKEPTVLVTQIATGAQTLFDGKMTPLEGSQADAEKLGQTLLDAATAALRDDRPRRLEGSDGDYFIHPFNPPKRLIIVGAVHIAQKLAPMAALAEFAVTIVDPRGAFASAERFPGVTLVSLWPDEALDSLALDRRCAVVTLTHDPKLDDPALASALNSEVFYIGSLGSRKTHAARLKRLAKEGFDDDTMARIHGPVGLALGAKSPAEIAVSILAQITQSLHAAPVLDPEPGA